MRVHSLAKIRELERLRRRGYSINELVVKLAIPKTTVWHHIHDVPILPRYLAPWNAKRGGSAKRSLRKWDEAKRRASELLDGPQRELAIILAMLYWGEGSKKVCEFINSDGRMIAVYLRIVRYVLHIPEKQIRPTLRVFSGMDVQSCLRYWSSITNIPKSRFLVRLNDGGTRGRTPHGMCRITIQKGSTALKVVRSLIDHLVAELEKVS